MQTNDDHRTGRIYVLVFLRLNSSVLVGDCRQATVCCALNQDLLETAECRNINDIILDLASSSLPSTSIDIFIKLGWEKTYPFTVSVPFTHLRTSY